MKVIRYLLCILLFAGGARAQLKYLVEDFEGFANGTVDLKKNGTFTYGDVGASIVSAGTSASLSGKPDHVGSRAMRITRKNSEEYGGWGKGVSALVQLDPGTDVLCLYIRSKIERSKKIKVSIQEDDNSDNVFKQEHDDQWVHELTLKQTSDEEWTLVTLPLDQFSDETRGGDGIFNCNYKEGKLLCLLISIDRKTLLKEGEWIDMDFICFSKGELQGVSTKSEGCSLGLWSAEGNKANFVEIATAFEQMYGKDKKLAVIHFFQPFSTDGTDQLSQYPSVDRVNKIIEQGYTPMITLENHYVNVNAKTKQPNLYSIVEGHMDAFFTKWAKEVKEMKGTVWVRILHEFNGNWYPWCIVNNDHDPDLFIKAYRHIHDIFAGHGTKNVRFVWCPNSMSIPQESWNYIMDAYPGDDYVDIVGMDVYNGAGDATLWHSFRSVAAENYFLFAEHMSNKPMVVCETASRERAAAEPGPAQTKSEWIRQMGEALQSDMTQVKLLTWFNEKSSFKLDSSPGAKKAYGEFILKPPYFKSGMSTLNYLTEN